MSHPCLHEREWGQLDEWRKDTTDKLDRILVQAIKTNSRVRALEVWRAVLMATLGTLLITQCGRVPEWVTQLLDKLL